MKTLVMYLVVALGCTTVLGAQTLGGDNNKNSQQGKTGYFSKVPSIPTDNLRVNARQDAKIAAEGRIPVATNQPLASAEDENKKTQQSGNEYESNVLVGERVGYIHAQPLEYAKHIQPLPSVSNAIVRQSAAAAMTVIEPAVAKRTMQVQSYSNRLEQILNEESVRVSADPVAAMKVDRIRKFLAIEQRKAAVAATVAQDTKATLLEGTDAFLPTQQIQNCCSKYIGGKTNGGYECLDWAKATFKDHPDFKVTECSFQDEQIARRRGRHTITVSYQIGAKVETKAFSEIYFFKE